MNYLGDLVHPNLVKLIGYCIEDDQRLLVYEFMPRGSLENHLFRSMRLFRIVCSTALDDVFYILFILFVFMPKRPFCSWILKSSLPKKLVYR